MGDYHRFTHLFFFILRKDKPYPQSKYPKVIYLDSWNFYVCTFYSFKYYFTKQDQPVSMFSQAKMPQHFVVFKVQTYGL